MSEQDNADLGLDSSGGQLEIPGTQPVDKGATVAKPDPSDKTGLRDSIKAAIAKQNESAAAKATPAAKGAPNDAPTKGPDGKFLPRDKTAAPAKAAPTPNDKAAEGGKTTDQAAQPGAVPNKDAAPGTWRAEAKAKWEALDPVVKAEVLKTQSESAREITKFQQQIQQINQAYTPIEQVIGPRRALWRAQFGSEAEALKRLTAVSDLATSSPNDFLAYYLSQPDVAAKVDMQKLFGQGEAGGALPAANPQLQPLLQEINGLKQQLNGFVSQAQTREQSTIEQQIAAFAKETDQSGAPLRPHWDAVSEDIYKMIPALKAQYPQATVQQVMDRAYTIATQTHPEIGPEVQRQNEERIRAEVEKAERAKRAQLANKSIPPGQRPGGVLTEQGNPKDLRATLLRNYRAVQEGLETRV